MHRTLIATALTLLGLVAGPTASAADGTENVSFETSDGLTLKATYHPPEGRAAEGAPTVVALHMYMNRRQSYEPIAAAVTSRGMALLAIDLRGHGESKVQGKEDLSLRARKRDAKLFQAMHLDAKAAIDWLVKTRKVPKGRIGLLGASVGCSVAIDAASRYPDDVACAATLTPGTAYLGVATEKHIAAWPAGKPLLVVSSQGEKDKGAAPIKKAMDAKGEPCEIVLVPGAAEKHGTRMFGKVEGIEDRVAAWLQAKTDGVVVDGDVRPYERHGRMELELGGVTFTAGLAGGALYVAARPAKDAKDDFRKLTFEVFLATDAAEDAERLNRTIPLTDGVGAVRRYVEREDAPPAAGIEALVQVGKIGFASGTWVEVDPIVNGKRLEHEKRLRFRLP